MTDRPILFSGPMVRALLEGRKTQTRRVLSANNLRIWMGGLDFGGGFVKPNAELFAMAMNDARQFRMIEHTLAWVTNPAAHQESAVLAQWQGKLSVSVGNRLWVREAWRCNGWAKDVATIFYRASEGDGYTAMCEQYPVDGKTYLRPTASWRPSIHMPRWVSRLTVVVDGVKVERLQDISEADAIAEGCTPNNEGLNPNHYGPSRDIFQNLWTQINGPGSWEANPWVAAYTFRVFRSNIDQIGGGE